MSEHFAGWDQRKLDLALDEVTVGLSDEERSELMALVGANELESLEGAVAEINVAALGKLESPPAALIRRLEADARTHFGVKAAAHVSSAPAASARRPKRSLLSVAGWLAAAIVLIAFAVDSVTERTLSPATRRESLLASAADLVRASWSPTEDPLAGGVNGDVVWSSRSQEGYMRFRSLAPNDPARSQYQLWIFDPTRDDWEAKPVDGGVFDVNPGDEVVVPINAKLEVRQAAMFAVTLEAPGGVVVSKREHLLALASP